MAAPGFTLTATLQTITGSAAGSASNPAKLEIVLCGFGLALPGVAGTSTLAQRKYTVNFTAAGQVSQALWGNDQIAPAGTWYSISVIDGRANVLQTGEYILSGAGTDLSQLLPRAAGYLVGAVPNGLLPGRGFALPTPMTGSQASAAFYVGGRLQDQSSYTLSAQGLQTTNFAVEAGDSIWVEYVTSAAIAGLPLKLWTAFANGIFPGTAYTLPTAPPGGQLAGVFYNGGLQRPGIDYTISGQNLTLLFTTDPPDPVTGKLPSLVALYAIGVIGTVTIEAAAGAFPGTVYTISSTPKAGILLGCYYNQLFQRPGIDYTLTGTTITLNFSTQAGDNVYAIYLA